MKRCARKLAWLGLSVPVVFNAVAFAHVRAMTHFVVAGVRTEPPERLSMGQKVATVLTGVTIPRPANRTTPETIGLAYVTHRFNSTDGISLEGWYIPHPGAKGVVAMFHGYAASKSTLLETARAFYDLGYEVFLVDFRGSGGSNGNETTIGVREAEDVAATVAYVRSISGDQPLILFGQSMGSAAILRAVGVLDVKATALVLESPFDALLSTVGNRFTLMGLPTFPFAHLLVFWGGVQQRFNGFLHNPADYAKQVTCPVLLMDGANDARVTPEQIRRIFDNLKGKKQLQILPAVGHESYALAAPDAWRATVSAFLDSTVQGRKTAALHRQVQAPL